MRDKDRYPFHQRPESTYLVALLDAVAGALFGVVILAGGPRPMWVTLLVILAVALSGFFAGCLVQSEVDRD